MKNIEKIFLASIEDNFMLKPSERVILGISGGPDSVCLLHLFYKYNSRLKLKILAAHFNHGLRKESDSEEKFVKELCLKLTAETLNSLQGLIDPNNVSEVIKIIYKTYKELADN